MSVVRAPSVATRTSEPVAVGPDGAYYVGQLAGFPVVAGAAKIYRVEAGSPPEVFLGGFTFIIGIAFDATGTLYVLQHVDGPGMTATGSLVRVAADGTRTTLIAGLTRPTGLAIGPDGRTTSRTAGSRSGRARCSASIPEERLRSGAGGLSAFPASLRM